MFDGFVVMLKFFGNPLSTREHGATSVEYALIVLVIALVMVGGAIALGEALDLFFGDAAAAF